MVAQLQLCLAGNTEHAFAHVQQVVAVVVASFGHEAQREPVEQHIATTVEDLLVATQLILSVANTIDGHYLQECEDCPEQRLSKDVGPGQEHRRLGGEIEHGERLHQRLLMTRRYDIGSVGGQILDAVDIKTVIVATATELHQWTEKIV